jgi:hypothetical protein
MKQKIAVHIDGGHLRVYARKAEKPYVPDYIEKIALGRALADEVIHRILYYGCRPYQGEAIQPVSGIKKSFEGSDKWLHELSHKDLFAVRVGVLKFRGFILKQSRIPLPDRISRRRPGKKWRFRGNTR